MNVFLSEKEVCSLLGLDCFMTESSSHLLRERGEVRWSEVILDCFIFITILYFQAGGGWQSSPDSAASEFADWEEVSDSSPSVWGDPAL